MKIISVLLPALSSMAAHIGTRKPLKSDFVQTILEQNKLASTEWHIKKLNQWYKILLQASRDANAPELYESRLKRSGVPESFAVLAVQEANGQPLPIVSNMESIDFGELLPGTSEVCHLKIKGGPGQIIIQNKNLSSNQDAFGPGETDIELTIKGNPDGTVIWDNILLHSKKEDVLIPFTGQWLKPLLSVEPRSISMGTIKVSTVVMAEITARGGPGEVIPGTDRITVSPAIFGPFDTQVAVKVANGSPGESFYGKVIFKNDIDQVTVPIAVRWDPLPLSVNPREIVFDNLNPESRPSLKIQVKGGPGEISASDESIHVSPSIIGPGDTEVEIRIKDGIPGSTMNKRLFIKSTLEEILVPVIAIWNPLPLSVSDQTIEFGSLRPGRSSTFTMKTSGGPAKAFTTSNNIRLSHSTVGPEDTSMEITVFCNSEYELRETLIIKNDLQEIEIPVYALWKTPKVEVKPQALDFGTLQLGQSATATLHVEGGPLKIEFDKDKFKVSPDILNKEDGDLEIKVLGKTPGKFKEEIIIKNPVSEIVVPVIAIWTRPPLSVDPAKIDFPIMKQGEAAACTLHIKGGPATIHCTSDLIKICPTSIGSEDTAVEIKIFSNSPQELNDKINIENEETNISVPVTAHWKKQPLYIDSNSVDFGIVTSKKASLTIQVKGGPGKIRLSSNNKNIILSSNRYGPQATDVIVTVLAGKQAIIRDEIILENDDGEIKRVDIKASWIWAPAKKIDKHTVAKIFKTLLILSAIWATINYFIIPILNPKPSPYLPSQPIISISPVEGEIGTTFIVKCTGLTRQGPFKTLITNLTNKQNPIINNFTADNEGRFNFNINTPGYNAGTYECQIEDSTTNGQSITRFKVLTKIKLSDITTKPLADDRPVTPTTVSEFIDKFDKETSGWSTYSETLSTAGYENNGYYISIGETDKPYQSLNQQFGVIREFSMEVDITQSGSITPTGRTRGYQAGGLVFGSFAYYISRFGLYSVYPDLIGGTPLVTSTNSPLIKTGSNTNRVKFIVTNGNMDLYVNEILLEQKAVPGMSAGYVGLVAQGNNTKVIFNNFKLQITKK